MIDVERKRGFLEAVLPHFIQQLKAPKELRSNFLSESILEKLPTYITCQDVLRQIRDDRLCADCFEHAIRTLNKDWHAFQPIAAKAVLDAINDWGFEALVDIDQMKLSSSRRDFLRIRFDIADTAFEDMSREIRRELEDVGLDPDKGRAREQILDKYFQFCVTRAYVDLAATMIANSPRNRDVIVFVTDRARLIYHRGLKELREVLPSFSLWRTPGGQYLHLDEAIETYRMDVLNTVEGWLSPFKQRTEEFLADIANAVPPGNILENCRKRMEGLSMSDKQNDKQSITFNIHGTNVQIGAVTGGDALILGNISQSIGDLSRRGERPIADALGELAKGVAETKTGISEPDRKRILQEIQGLADLAKAPEASRNPGVVGAVVRSLGISLAAASLKHLWDAHSMAIVHFFQIATS